MITTGATIAASAVVSTDYIQIFRTTTGESEIISASSVPGIMGVGPAEDTTATNVLTAAECGKVLWLNSSTEFVTTLPAPATYAGCRFKIIVKAAPSGADYTVVTTSGADIIVLGVNELETDTGDDGPYDDNADVVTFVGGTSVAGDWIDCVTDGTKWYCNGQTNADGAITSGTT